MVGDTTSSLDFFLELKKKFRKFCANSPLYVDIDFSGARIGLKNLTTEEVKVFTVDVDKTTTENISDVKAWLIEHWYPYLEEKIVDVSAPSTAEILRRSRAGEPVEHLLTEERETIKIVRWVIERVTDKNEVVLANQDIPWLQSIYRLHVPAESFIKRLSRKELSPMDGWIELHESMIADHCYDYDKRKRSQDETVPSDPD
jgi:hypothetical protein